MRLNRWKQMLSFHCFYISISVIGAHLFYFVISVPGGTSQKFRTLMDWV